MKSVVLTALQKELSVLQVVLQSSGPEIYARPSVINSGATIGQHCRHILELIDCLFSGYSSGIINYDKRKRDRLLETDLSQACTKIDEFIGAGNKPDCILQLEGIYGEAESEPLQMQTTYLRELAYNVEHLIHHLALIKTALVEFGIPVSRPGFGVAYATQQYRLSCAP